MEPPDTAKALPSRFARRSRRNGTKLNVSTEDSNTASERNTLSAPRTQSHTAENTAGPPESEDVSPNGLQSSEPDVPQPVFTNTKNLALSTSERLARLTHTLNVERLTRPSREPTRTPNI
jgi:hypothetical protein